MKKHVAAILCILIVSAPALAHVKWFAKMANCANTPLIPSTIFASTSFLWLSMATLAVIALVFRIDNKLARWQVGSLSPIHKILGTDLQSLIIRIGTSAYFILLALYFQDTAIILTPELKTSAEWIPYLQLFIGITILSRTTSFIGAAGIATLYVYAVSIYGWFHLLDYVFFLGIAVYLALDASSSRGNGRVALAVLRVATGCSFLWVGVEKWTYPDWTYEILAFQLKDILMGFTPQFFVMAAGFVEFCLAFLLIYGRMSSQVAAAVLALMLVAAMPAVGPVDAIGHLPIVAVLIVLAGSTSTVPSWSDPHSRAGQAKRVMLFAAAVPGMTGAYYLAHDLAYARADAADWAAISGVVLLASLLTYTQLIAILSRLLGVRSRAKS